MVEAATHDEADVVARDLADEARRLAPSPGASPH
jgi:hypothetical protein